MTTTVQDCFSSSLRILGINVVGFAQGALGLGVAPICGIASDQEGRQDQHRWVMTPSMLPCADVDLFELASHFSSDTCYDISLPALDVPFNAVFYLINFSCSIGNGQK